MNTDLIIVGAGAAGLMAGAVAGEAGIAAVVLERRHRAGLKLLLCGNNRCNISHGGTTADMAKAYGDPVGAFLRDALTVFPPARLRTWFAAAGMPTSLNRDRIYPKTEKADDVLHCFTDRLRDTGVPLVLNCPVNSISADPTGGFVVSCDRVTLRSRMVLIATGGVSYPKTGSVGDGQRIAGELGHSVTPFRAGLAGMDVADAWLTPAAGAAEVALPFVRLQLSCDGEDVASVEGNVLCGNACLRGSAVFDTTRIIARQNLRDCVITMDLFPTQSPAGLAAKITALTPRCDGQLATLVKQLGIDEALAAGLAAALGGNTALRKQDVATDLAASLKAMPIALTAVRPLKEAIVTVGGVSMDDIDPATMESKRVPGLFFAGEVMDVDGPTGGYNLHAAFATAQLAMQAIKKRCPNTVAPTRNRGPADIDEQDDDTATSRAPQAPQASKAPRGDSPQHNGRPPRSGKPAYGDRPPRTGQPPGSNSPPRPSQARPTWQRRPADANQPSPDATPSARHAGRSRLNTATSAAQWPDRTPNRPERPERPERPDRRHNKRSDGDKRPRPTPPSHSEAPWWAKSKKDPGKRQ